ncbi:MAG: TRAP transporter substrate-binding protein DctP [Oscillospiraceae bacterium]|nr:TRAP transporter substrate-binding protein DctP [Oscillospiraceae bacterium]
MKKNKKFIALFLCAALCVLALAGCGSSSSTTSTTTNSDTSSGTRSDSASTASDDTVYTFTVVNHDSINSMGELWVETLLGAISEESGGRLQFNYYAGGSMYGATETIDAVKDGAADICWFTNGSYGGVFPISEFVNVVGTVNSAQMASAVLNTAVEEIPEAAAEFANWHVLVLHGTSTSPLSTVGTKIETPDDLKGLSIRAAGTTPTLYLNTIGCTAISMPTSDVYDALSKKTLDGMANDWHNIDCFNLYEPIDYCMDVVLNATASGLLMNTDRWNELPEDLQEIFNKYCSSYFAADMAGYWWDSCRYWVGDEMLENGVEIYEPSDEVYDYMFSDEVLNTVHESYISYLDGYGYDGQALWDQLCEIADRYEADYAGVWDAEFNYADWDMSTVDGYQAVYGG